MCRGDYPLLQLSLSGSTKNFMPSRTIPNSPLAGFAQGFPYNDWLKRAESLGASPQPVQLAFIEETGFFLGDLWELGWVYMTTADDNVISQENSDYITGMERTIRAGIAIAKCE